MNPTILGVKGPGFLNQVPTLSLLLLFALRPRSLVSGGVLQLVGLEDDCVVFLIHLGIVWAVWGLGFGGRVQDFVQCWCPSFPVLGGESGGFWVGSFVSRLW